MNPSDPPAGKGKSGTLGHNSEAKSSVTRASGSPKSSDTNVTVRRHRGEKQPVSAPKPLTAEKGSAPKSKEQKRREAEARNRAYAALKNHRKRIDEIDKQLERDNARMDEIMALLADPDFYTREEGMSDVIAEHARIGTRNLEPNFETCLLKDRIIMKHPVHERERLPWRKT